MIAALGIIQDSVILIIGAMVVGPEFGRLAGLSVALVQRKRRLARRSVKALAVGFPVAIAAALALTAVLRAVDSAPERLGPISRPATLFISHPDEYTILSHCSAGRRARSRFDGEVGRARRRAHLSDHHPCSRQRRRCLGLRRLERGRRRRRSARPQPRLHRHRGRRDTLTPALVLPTQASGDRGLKDRLATESQVAIWSDEFGTHRGHTLPISQTKTPIYGGLEADRWDSNPRPSAWQIAQVWSCFRITRAVGPYEADYVRLGTAYSGTKLGTTKTAVCSETASLGHTDPFPRLRAFLR